MKRLVKRISLPLLFLVGLTLIGPQTAEAARWRRYARGPYVRVAPPVVYSPRVRVYAPGVRVYAPGVRVYAPGDGVDVGPGVNVDAPGVRVRVQSWYPSRYGRPYYRW